MNNSATNSGKFLKFLWYINSVGGPESVRLQRKVVEAYLKPRSRVGNKVRRFKEACDHGELPIRRRPALLRLFCSARTARGSRVVVDRLSRFGDTPESQALVVVILERLGAEIDEAFTTTQTDAVWLDMKERAVNSAELRKCMQHIHMLAGRVAMRAAGRLEGRKPFGYSEEEKKVLERMQELRRKPNRGRRLPWRKIAALLNADGLLTRSKCEWTGPNVANICRRRTERQRSRKKKVQ